ncbi:SipW-dependent-type signal peptide-containing protein [Microbacterium sp. SSW1-59]|uniref:SipW-dependent-type signal peptide-containing protein n=1 Tax=Microbacterium xanthum TaxID=3079794 RepID=UPI002AD2D328|nr:SipW-dependent-type signal peptide-containing protein [Microbacterium sp. SSW1-59]MDZ8201276.1 SipW-dependent-type signal peptide-containing protein [Microbacterium sp. SSW1-59]
MEQQQRRTVRRRIFAITAGGAALGLGVAATLAAWTDTEWVFGGDGSGGPGIGTSTFAIEQNTDAPGYDAGSWVDEPDNPGGEMVFEATSLLGTELAPGDSVYAAVALRTKSTSIAGDVQLEAAVPATGITTNDTGGLLFAALDVRVATSATTFDCDATAFSGDPGSPTVIANGDLASTGGSATQSLSAAAGSVQYYCFEVTLPASINSDPDPASYMGRTVAPAWEFVATS